LFNLSTDPLPLFRNVQSHPELNLYAEIIFDAARLVRNEGLVVKTKAFDVAAAQHWIRAGDIGLVTFDACCGWRCLLRLARIGRGGHAQGYFFGRARCLTASATASRPTAHVVYVAPPGRRKRYPLLAAASSQGKNYRG